MTSIKRFSILVIDDSPEEVRIMLDCFSEIYDVFFALNGLQSLEIAECEHPDLILLDIHMDEMDGFEVCRRIKLMPGIADTPIIFVTGSPGESNHLKGLEMGAVDFIEKPINTAVLKQRVKFHLRLKSTIESNLNEINARKKAEENLRNSEARLKALSDASFEAIFLLDDGICRGQNQTAEKMFGYTSAEAEGRRYLEWIAAKNHEIVMHNMISGYDQPYELTGVRKDGTLFPCEIQSRMIASYKGKSTRVLALRDITERKLAQKALRDSEEISKSKSEFLANISHEIRTPMNAILGFTEFTLKSPDLPESHKKKLSIVHESAKQLMILFDDILDIIKLETGKVKLRENPFHLNRLMDDIIQIFRDEILEKGLNLSLQIHPGISGYYKGDKERLRQVLINLLGNAVKFTNKGGISVSVAPGSSGRLLFSIADTGIGIPSEKIGKIFEPFTQADGSLSRKFGGMGLGTTISTHLVRLMGGRIWVESEVGKGSIFYFTVQLKSEGKHKLESSINNRINEDNLKKAAHKILFSKRIDTDIISDLLNSMIKSMDNSMLDDIESHLTKLADYLSSHRIDPVKKYLEQFDFERAKQETIKLASDLGLDLDCRSDSAS